jgi:Fe-S-cluster containining protein
MIDQCIPQKVCLECRGCCRFACADSPWSPVLLKTEISRLAKKTRLVYDRKQDSYICASLDAKNNRCKAYRIRPFDCRLYPFLFDRKADKVFLALDLNCPFAKKNLDTPTFKKHIRYLTVALSVPDFVKVLRKNPRFAQAYPDVLDLVEINL